MTKSAFPERPQMSLPVLCVGPPGFHHHACTGAMGYGAMVPLIWCSQSNSSYAMEIMLLFLNCEMFKGLPF
jgi:hypothetical protein